MTLDQLTKKQGQTTQNASRRNRTIEQITKNLDKTPTDQKRQFANNIMMGNSGSGSRQK